MNTFARNFLRAFHRERISKTAHGHCSKCYRTNDLFRLYRPYGSFYRPVDTFCNAHILRGEHEGYVPLIFDKNGEVWGYCAVPEDECEAFYALPDADPTARCWSRQVINLPAPEYITHWTLPL